MSIMPALALSLVAAAAVEQVQWRPASPAAVPLNRADLDQQAAAANKLLRISPPPIGQSESWANPASGRSGNITLLDAAPDRRTSCRRLRFEVSGLGEVNSYVFKLCQAADGKWKIAE